ncbi:cysteinyl-tRNA synthetase [Thecamonas trahens ATCC 50062]|uniref:cysteine--tRNA ligase n=1 Tax=Thecamonas trahens ATCC 50062 TaxID=461836 RepID=A0A0L0DR55_THETB|nr:cysteinyl-tRNA synthetase [Thecamonas trahens ATCC 50062]KNC54794.1 cysteinyl-tRNA synthetase [Thecamonas trahens ATCC 50062]|eukprot:XP_013761694.1 cysteinyl-tRNA synthetase [Thecamonas trahens ATCC 50062]
MDVNVECTHGVVVAESSSFMADNSNENHWAPPGDKDAVGSGYKGLHVLNTLTKNKDAFVPKNGNRVNWYICGPTVYDSAHLGHARAYLSFDIIRRILEDYFGYDVHAVMNITDVDDKIILRARQNYLFDEYKAAALVGSVPDVAADIAAAIEGYGFEAKAAELAEQETPESVAKAKLLAATKSSAEAGLASLAADGGAGEAIDAARDVLAVWLDAAKGASVTDLDIFAAHTRKYETEYLEDMEALGVRPPHALTRVSEYVDEIIEMTAKIVERGLGYVSNGSVYFATGSFMDAGHVYAKLAPEMRDNAKALAEGEGALAADSSSEKRSLADFALWKASKAGEPAWDSPWGRGRPGWHIECSAMAGAILGDHLDIHGGGVDLKFPHHDNELAQSEAYFGCHQWTSYFLHAGHLHIHGSKMSKSLKNFQTIREALESYSARQIRLLFLLHSWEGGLDYSNNSMQHAKDMEKKLREFFLNVSTLVREETPARSQKWGDAEVALESAIAAATADVDAALKDSFDTPKTMHVLADLISAVNVYRSAVGDAGVKSYLLMQAARFVARILGVFGVIDPLYATVETGFGFGSGALAGTGDAGSSSVVVEILTTLSKFRDAVRAGARAKASPGELLALCDELRDEILPELGVRLEDRDTGVAIVKLDDRETLLAERDERRAARAAREANAAAKAAARAAEQAARDARDSTPPADFFRLPEFDGQFSAFDDGGMPTADADGEPLKKSKLKNLTKQLKTHVKKHNKWLARQ